MGYSEYPKFMKHPQHKPAVLSRDIVNPDRTITKAAPGQPERFPDVLVHNKDQEIDYASRGYAPAGTSDPEAYLRAISGNAELDSQKHHEYPKWLYQAHEDGEIEVNLDSGDTIYVKSVLVDHEAGEKKLKGEWHPNPGAAAKAFSEEAFDQDAEEQGEAGKDAPQPNAEKKNVGGRPKKAAE